MKSYSGDSGLEHGMGSLLSFYFSCSSFYCVFLLQLNYNLNYWGVGLDIRELLAISLGNVIVLSIRYLLDHWVIIKQDHLPVWKFRRPSSEFSSICVCYRSHSCTKRENVGHKAICLALNLSQIHWSLRIQCLSCVKFNESWLLCVDRHCLLTVLCAFLPACREPGVLSPVKTDGTSMAKTASPATASAPPASVPSPSSPAYLLVSHFVFNCLVLASIHTTHLDIPKENVEETVSLLIMMCECLCQVYHHWHPLFLEKLRYPNDIFPKRAGVLSK